MRAYSEIIGGQTGPEASDTLLGHGLCNAVTDARVGHLACSRVSLLLLHLCLDVVEGEGAHRD